jgi:sterol desaturase/sphingolipid hydroxylase (fatty acid hydroxylase superfamily)
VQTWFYTDELMDTVRRWDGTLLGPGPENKKREGITVFKAKWFEDAFAKAHPIMPGVWWGPVFAFCIYLTVVDPRFNPTSAFAHFALGVLGWTLVEYFLHRLYFHHDFGDDFEGRLKAFMVHGYHHEFPNDRMRLVAPLLLSMIVGAPIAAVEYLLAGSYHWLACFAGSIVGYLAYDWIHYYTHHFAPTTRLGKFMRRYHMEHHYKDSNAHFGISSPLWDLVFGTWRAESKQPAPATTKG